MTGALDLKIGDPLGVRPEGEGPAPVLVGGGFEVFCFYAGLTPAEVRGFASGHIACGVYVEEAIPVLVLDIEGFGGLEVAFNIFAEPENKRRAFFEAAPQAGSANLILCDHPDSIVRAVRIIRPGAMLLGEIKNACFDQLSLYRNMGQCFQAMSALYDTLGPEDIRARVVMRPA